MDINSHVWFFVFSYLGPQDLVYATLTCYSWWKIVYRGYSGFFRKVVTSEFNEIDISSSGNLYTRLPVSAFGGITRLSLESTRIKRKHLLQIFKISKLQYLNISHCGLEDEFIFYTKKHFKDLIEIDISNNENITVLGIACLCSLPALRLVQAHGLKLSEKELLFLYKTFTRVKKGLCDIDFEDGDYCLDICREFEHELDDFL